MTLRSLTTSTCSRRGSRTPKMYLLTTNTLGTREKLCDLKTFIKSPAGRGRRTRAHQVKHHTPQNKQKTIDTWERAADRRQRSDRNIENTTKHTQLRGMRCSWHGTWNDSKQKSLLPTQRVRYRTKGCSDHEKKLFACSSRVVSVNSELRLATVLLLHVHPRDDTAITTDRPYTPQIFIACFTWLGIEKQGIELTTNRRKEECK